ncbi:hypothetical protein [Nocardiopsis valliformis]|uniref:hypothetical protein n=1 Tax=Nocardiopsis valliformis TaxID=239974 RepID=UPI00034564C4|nr:hypothetical protein [Nocardiopsis valliformis]
MTPISRRAKFTSRITATTALAACLALLLPGTAFAEMGQVRTESREVIITEEGVYEVGEDVESLEVFLEENPEYAPAVEDPDGISTLANTSLPLTHGTLTTSTTNCNSATVRYSKTSGSRLTIRFSIAQVGRLTQTGGIMSIVAGQSRSYSVSLRPIGNVQGRMYVTQQGTTFTNNYISCR